MTNEKIASQCLEFIRHAESSQKLQDRKDRAVLNQDFLRGIQWTKDEWDYYKTRGVKPHTINRCLPTILVLCGMQSQNSQQIKVRPRKGATEGSANIYTELIKHTEDLSSDEGGEYVYSRLFKRGVVDGDSYIRADIDKDRNPNGQITFKVRSTCDIDVDPTANEYNVNASAKYVIDKSWVDKDYLKNKYGSAIDKAVEQGVGISDDGQDSNGVLAFLLDDADIDTGDRDGDEQYKKFRYRIREVFWKEQIKGLLVIDHQTGKRKIETKKIDILERKAGKSTRFTIRKVTQRLHQTIMLGRFVLDDVENPFGETISDYPIFRFSPHFDNGYCFGVLDNIISLNREENIARTQYTRLLNQTVNSGFKVGGGTKKKKRELANYGSVEGAVIDESDYGGKVDKFQPNIPSTGHMINAEQFEGDVKQVSGIDNATLGYDSGKAESGRAIYLKQKQGQITTEAIFKNFYSTLQSFGKFILNTIRAMQIYTDDEIKAVVSESSLLTEANLTAAKNELELKIGAGLPEPMQPNVDPQQVLQMTRPADRLAVMQTIKAGMESAQIYLKHYPMLRDQWDKVIKGYAVRLQMEDLKKNETVEYGVKVDLSPTAPTVRLSNYLELSEIQDKYGLVPPDLLIDSTDLTNKDEIKERLRQAAQQQQTQPAQPQVV